ncbi:MAG: MerR family transcriptional regulator [Eubacteriales bacterium]|nr:MerR family transcriptional regulator [Eubacteriales bacterium]
MKISELCQYTNVSRRNVHFYIKEGLLIPATNKKNNYYDFSEADCLRLQFIRDMRNAEMPLATIRAILNNPFTSSYYLSAHMQSLRNEQRHIEQTMVSLRYILDNVPLYADLQTLGRVTQEAAIPEKKSEEMINNHYDRYAGAVINQILWGGFLPEEKMSEYQEFLWAKINRITMEEPSPEYIRLAKTLYVAEASLVDMLLSHNVEQYRLIENLKEDDIVEYAARKMEELKTIIHTPGFVAIWKNHYENFFKPITMIQASNLSGLMAELSPSYRKYVNNINRVCGLIFDRLSKGQETVNLEEMSEIFGDKIDLIHSNHGQIEAILNVPVMWRMMK